VSDPTCRRASRRQNRLFVRTAGQTRGNQLTFIQKTPARRFILNFRPAKIL
jgi:hypothetical protein